LHATPKEKKVSDQYIELVEGYCKSIYYLAKAAESYGRATNVRRIPVDTIQRDEMDVKTLRRRIQRPARPDTDRARTIQAVIENCEVAYAKLAPMYNAQNLLLGEQELIDEARSEDPLFASRNEWTADMIRDVAQTTEGKVVHLCGAGHGLRDALGQTLYTHLEKLGATRRLLSTY